MSHAILALYPSPLPSPRAPLLRAPITRGRGSSTPDDYTKAKLRRAPDLAPRLSPQRSSGDEGALAVLRALVSTQAKDVRGQVLAWVEAIDQRSQGGRAPLSVLEHTAVGYVLRSGFFDAGEDGAIEARLQRSLERSWTHLTGRAPAPGETSGRLPKQVLRKASREARLYHAASFIPIGDREAQRQASSLLRDYVPEDQDLLVLATTLLAGAFSDTAGATIAAAVLSYGVVALTESLLHRHLAHPTGKVGGWILEGPKAEAGWLERGVHRAIAKFMKPILEGTRHSHEQVHHGLTFRRSFTQMFDSPEHQRQVDDFIRSLGDERAQEIWEEQYGTTLSRRGLLNVMLTVAPQTAALVAAGLFFGAPVWCALPLIAVVALYPFTMKNVHPHLHHDEAQAREAAGPLMKAVLNTRWAAWACRNHWLHHRVDGNYNLSFPGADALLGTLLQPNLRDLFQMRAQGVLHY